MKTFVWLVKREIWENPAIWRLPAVIGAALTLAALFGKVEIAALVSPDQSRAVGGVVLFAFGVVFFVVMSLYSSWYLLDCLYADRKDRSILFWKSLPITDSVTVFSKLFTGLVVIPLVYFIAADLSTVLIAFIVSVRARATLGGALWQPDLWLQLQVLWLYLIATTGIWYLPFAGWLLAVSAWAKRAVVLWSILLPLAACLLERWFLGTRTVSNVLADRTFDYLPTAFDFSNRNGWVTTTIGEGRVPLPGSVWGIIRPLGFFASAATWIGAVVGIALIAAAVQFRLRRTEA